MPVLHLKDGDSDALGPVTPQAFQGTGLDWSHEIEAMVVTLQSIDYDQPDRVMTACMAFMARCTEMWIQLLRIEAVERRAKSFRTMQLQKVMDLIEFEFKGASRLIEVRRQDVELSR